jgi:hypothetical protein
MLALARDEHPLRSAPSRAGVRSHQLLLALLAGAVAPHPRRAVVRELMDALGRRGAYAGSVEELTPVGRDPMAALPVVVMAAALLAWPASAAWLAGRSVGGYALTPAGWSEVVRRVA